MISHGIHGWWSLATYHMINNSTDNPWIILHLDHARNVFCMHEASGRHSALHAYFTVLYIDSPSSSSPSSSASFSSRDGEVGSCLTETSPGTHSRLDICRVARLWWHTALCTDTPAPVSLRRGGGANRHPALINVWGWIDSISSTKVKQKRNFALFILAVGTYKFIIKYILLFIIKLIYFIIIFIVL